MSDKLNAALDHARAGFQVFPLVPNAKTPLIANWQNLATSDESQIRQWWQSEPNANPAILTERLVVLDIDPRNGGDATWTGLTMVEEFPKTCRSETWSGGAHVLYRLPPGVHVRGGANKLGPGVDVKSHGGYIVAPGATIDGKPYRWGNTRPLHDAPQWLIERCKQANRKSDKAGQRIVEEDDMSVELAWRYAEERAPEAHHGEIDDTCYKVAARLFDFGVSIDTAIEIVTWWSETHCFPPMQPERIQTVTESASRNRGNAVGAKHPQAPGFEPVEIAPRPAPQPTVPAGQQLTIPAHEAARRALTNPARPLIKGLLDRGTLAVLYGAPGGGKSFLGLHLAAHVGAGREVCGMRVHRGAVVYVAAEGGEGIFARLAAIEQHCGKLDDTALHILPHGLDLLRSTADADALIKEIARLEQVHGVKVELVIVDTVARVLAGGDENSGQDMGALIRNLDRVRVTAACTVLGIHHTGKDKARGARGHSSLLGAVDTEMEVDAGRLTITKQRDMGKNVALRFLLKPVRIGMDPDGDEVVSCYVDLFADGSGGAMEQVPLTPEQQAFVEMLDASLEDDNLSVFNLAYATEVARKCVVVSGGDIRGDIAFKRTTMLKRMSLLVEKCHLRKVARNQWSREMSPNVT